MKAPLAILASLTTFATALEVHEWGTFTVLSGSNGFQVPWYATYSDHARLPDFVSKGISGKSGYARIRMETPVIYFYPEKQQKVTVDVSFTGGTISETFPHSVGGKIEVNPGPMMISMSGHWSGTLLPPTDRDAIAGIPAILKKDPLEPYGAAREVPDAWIFQSDLKEIPGLQVQPHFPQQEKFIFYRGAGSAGIPIDATMDGDVATVTNHSNGGPIPFGVALRVRGGKAAWAPLPALAPAPTGDEPAMNRSQVAFPQPDRSLDEVESELAGVWKKALADDGLTTAEASAMVETWRKTWFRENGDRILSLVPQKTVDRMLPLKITPAPEKTVRVFVARIEMLAPDRENGLVSLMNSTKAVDGKDFERFGGLGLGRFGNGAMGIATQIQVNRMNAKFFELGSFGANLETTAR